MATTSGLLQSLLPKMPQQTAGVTANSTPSIAAPTTPPAQQQASPSLGQKAANPYSAPASGSNTNTIPSSYQAPPSQVNGTAQTGSSSQEKAPITSPNPTPQYPSGPDTSYGGLIGKLVGTVNGSNSTVNDANSALTNFRQQMAQQVGDIRSEAIPLVFQQGRVQAVQTANAGKEQALQQGVQNALTERGQNITGLGTAISAAAPQAVSYSNQYLNPQTGTPINPQAGQDIASQVALHVQRIQNNQETLQDAQSALGAYGLAGTNALQTALGSGFNVNTNAGAASGQQTAATVPGTVNAQQQTQIAGYKSAQQQGQNLASQASDLINTFGLNPSDLNAANGGIQRIAENTSSWQYKALNNYLADIASRYSQILTPPGGTATDTTRSVASGMLDNLASGTSLQKVLQTLDDQANAVIAGVPTSSGSQGSSNSGSSGNSVTEGSKTSAGGYNFVYQGGKWVPA